MHKFMHVRSKEVISVREGHPTLRRLIGSLDWIEIVPALPPAPVIEPEPEVEAEPKPKRARKKPEPEPDEE